MRNVVLNSQYPLPGHHIHHMHQIALLTAALWISGSAAKIALECYYCSNFQSNDEIDYQRHVAT